ncbi:MAG TPA: ABC transporter ATP-binding protein, partial [Anaerolineae bacterium]|nr:ABC transporter ATP-binding protein [Anaerolineae bacterium]
MSFSSSPGMGPRGALRNFGKEGKDGRLFDWRVIRGMLTFVWPFWRRMLAATLLMLVATGLTLWIPYLMKEAIDGPILSGDEAGLNRLAGLLAGAFILLYVAQAGQEYLLSWVGQRVLTNLRQALFEHLQALSLRYHDTTIVGVTVSRVINDVAVINDFLTQGLITLLGDLLVLAGILVVMVQMSPELALYTFTVLPLMALVTTLFSWQAKPAFRLTRKSVAAVVGRLAENIDGLRVIQSFAQEGRAQARFGEVNEANWEANTRAVGLSFVFLPAVEFLGVLATAIVLLFGGRMVIGTE